MQFERAKDYILKKLATGLPGHLTYHCPGHVSDVCEAAGRIGQSEGISAYEMKLLLTAASYHDAGFLKGAQGHEEESCRMVRAILPGFDYTPEEIDKVSNMIMATKIPQSPSNHLEEILADADLDYLGRDDFFSIGDTLYAEFSHFGIVHNEDEWNSLQVRFLESHRYFTKTAINDRQAKKQQHLQMVKAKLEK